MTFTYSAEIKAPIEKVYSFVTDPVNDTRWMKYVVFSKQMTAPPYGVGTNVRHVFDALGQRTDIIWNVDQYEPPRLLTLSGESDDVKVKGTLSLSPSATGTRIAMEAEATLKGFISVMEPLIRSHILPTIEGSIQTLRTLLETENQNHH